MFDKKGIEANVMILIVVVLGLVIITGIFVVIYGALNLATGDIELESYSSAEVKSLNNELYVILFGENNLADLIIKSEVLDKKKEVDSEVNKALNYYGDDREYSLIINYKDKESIIYGETLEGPGYLDRIESSLKLPSLKNDFIEVKLVSAFLDLNAYNEYYGGNII